MDYGQGLIFGSGLRFGKGVEPVTTIRRNNLGLRPYRSVFENRDFSGFAISTSFSHIELNMFYSFVKRDAAIKEGTISEVDQYISSIQTIGLHRTQSEINAKNQLTDQTIGANLNFKPFNNNLELGLNGVFSNYSLPLLPNTRKYNQFDFAGLNNHLGGFYINYFLRKAHIFGEFAFSKSGGKAISSGIIASLSSQVQASLHIRKHEKDFHSFYGAAFGENTKIGNENGIYWGLKISPLQRLIITTYLDVFDFPWLKYQVDAPSKGNDFMISAIYKFTPKLNLRIQYRSKLKEMNYNIEDTPQVQILPKVTKRLLLNMDYLLSDFFSIQTRIQQSNVNFNNTNSNGFMIAQDINFQRQKISVSARFALFDTDNYDSRQYIYERDLLYLYSIPSFYNRGIRYFLLMKYKLWKNVDLWLKISQTKYTDQESIGTGLEKIDGNRRTNLNAQIRIKL